MTNGIYLLLGSNLGIREMELSRAAKLISTKVGAVVDVSSIYETAPWGKSDQGKFLNQVIKVDYKGKPVELLSRIQQIEIDMGRKRIEKWAERIIDIDILYFHDQVLNSLELKIPHPELANRRFTLVPLCEIAPEFRHPVLKKNNVALLEECPDQLPVEKKI